MATDKVPVEKTPEIIAEHVSQCGVQEIVIGECKDEPVATRKELWSYYLYYCGDNSIGPQWFTLTLFQSLVYAAGFDPSQGPGHPCTSSASSDCVVPWSGGGTLSVSSVILIANGISFAIMTFLFTTLGSVADYGTNSRWMLLGSSVICWGAQFAVISLQTPSTWRLAMTLFVIGFSAYGATQLFYVARFPRLARNTPHMRSFLQKYEAGEISGDDFDAEGSLEKNRICNISVVFSNIGYVVMLCLNLSLLLPLGDNPLVNNYVIVLLTAISVITGVWWLVFQQTRPGPPIPKGQHYLTIGWNQILMSCRQYRKLPYAFIYLFALFLFSGAFTTTTLLVQICQNDQVQFGFLENTYLGLSQAISAVISTFALWQFQKWRKVTTKKMFAIVNVGTILITLWGMIGIWTQKFGFHNIWEFWAFNVMYGLFQTPYWAFGQTMMAEVAPPGFDNMFFGLLGISQTASAMVVPVILTAIIDRTRSNWMGFPFLFSLSLTSSLIIWFGVDVEKGRKDAAVWAKEVRMGYTKADQM